MATVIPSIEIDKSEFSELSIDILGDMVNGDSSPFKDVQELLRDYLDTAVDLDATQQAGIFSDWLKQSYMDINKQAMSTALELLKTNASLEMQRYSEEADMHLKEAQTDKVIAETAILGKDDIIKDEELALIQQQVINAKVAYMVEMGKVEKQYGYGDAGLDPVLDLAMGESTDDGALDKQIEGYTKLNYKDVLKTMDEKAALMQNAKVAETLYEKQARIETMYEISGLNYELVDSGLLWTYTPAPLVPFGGTWASTTAP